MKTSVLTLTILFFSQISFGHTYTDYIEFLHEQGLHTYLGGDPSTVDMDTSVCSTYDPGKKTQILKVLRKS